jgi:hypothetical protein
MIPEEFVKSPLLIGHEVALAYFLLQITIAISPIFLKVAYQQNRSSFNARKARLTL